MFYWPILMMELESLNDEATYGPAQKTWFFQMVPKSFLSGLIYSTRGVNMISWKFCRKFWPEPTHWVRQTFVWDKWAERFLDFAGFSSFVPLVMSQELYFND